LSADGKKIAVFRFVDGNMDIWSYEIRRRLWERLTFALGDDIYPLWLPDGASIVFGGVRKDRGLGIYRKPITGPEAAEELVLTTSIGKFPTDISPDGQLVLFDSLPASDAGSIDIRAVPLAGERKPFDVIQTEFNERSGQFSPDGNWVAYQSDKT